MRKTVDFEFCRLPCRSCGPGGGGGGSAQVTPGLHLYPSLTPPSAPGPPVTTTAVGVALRVAHTHESPVVWCLCECHVGRFRFCLVVSASFRGSLG